MMWKELLVLDYHASKCIYLDRFKFTFYEHPVLTFSRAPIFVSGLSLLPISIYSSIHIDGIVTLLSYILVLHLA